MSVTPPQPLQRTGNTLSNRSIVSATRLPRGAFRSRDALERIRSSCWMKLLWHQDFSSTVLHRQHLQFSRVQRSTSHGRQGCSANASRLPVSMLIRSACTHRNASAFVGRCGSGAALVLIGRGVDVCAHIWHCVGSASGSARMIGRRSEGGTPFKDACISTTRASSS